MQKLKKLAAILMLVFVLVVAVAPALAGELPTGPPAPGETLTPPAPGNTQGPSGNTHGPGFATILRIILDMMNAGGAI